MKDEKKNMGIIVPKGPRKQGPGVKETGELEEKYLDTVGQSNSIKKKEEDFRVKGPEVLNTIKEDKKYENLPEISLPPDVRDCVIKFYKALGSKNLTSHNNMIQDIESISKIHENFSGLGPKKSVTLFQKLIVAVYMQTNGSVNLTAKYIQKNPTYIREVLKKPHVQKYVHNKLNSRLKVLGLDTTDILNELITISTSNLSDYVSWDNNTVILKDSSELTEDELKCVESVEKVYNNKGHASIKIKLYDKLKALNTLTKLIPELNTQTIRHEHNINMNDDDNDIDIKDLKAELIRAGLLK